MVKKTKKKVEKVDFEKEKRKDKNTVIAIAIIAAVVSVIVAISYEVNPTNNDADKAPMIDGIRCQNLPSKDTQYAHMDVIIGGKTQQLPAGIGIINNTCKYWIYTQDTTGIIHINPPGNMRFTLSQFFNIWKATSNVPPAGVPIIYVNGQKSPTKVNDTEIKPREEIAIIYGIKPAIIPSSYEFPPSS